MQPLFFFERAFVGFAVVCSVHKAAHQPLEQIAPLGPCALGHRLSVHFKKTRA